MKNILTDAALVCAFALIFGPTHAAPQAPPSAASILDSTQVAAWRQDLRFMATEVERRHRNLYHTVSKPVFDRAVHALHSRIPILARHQVIVEMARIAALVEDGHTNMAPTRDPKIGFTTLPIRLYFFKDGLFIRAAHRSHADLAGSRVVRIGTTTPDQAYARVRELVGRDNEMDARFFAPFLLAMPEVLHALGITSRMDEAAFTVERAGERKTVRLRPLEAAPMMPSDTDVSWWPDSSWTDMRDRGAAPLWLRKNPLTRYWLERRSPKRLVYVQYNKVANKDDEPLDRFSQRLEELIDSAPADRVVLDLRLNRGANGTLNRPLLLSLIKSPKLEGRGKLFVIIGRSTFSAAQFLVNELEQYTDAVFVGEPSGGKVNSYGDSRKIILPHSGLTVRVSTLWWQEDPRDSRQWGAPDIAAELTSADYRANVDPAMKAVLDYRPEPAVVDRMAEALSGGSIPEAVRVYRQHMAEPRHAYADEEMALNSLGYRLLGEGRHDHAIAVLELNASEHPQSSNAYDSLGEAYYKAGRPDPAARNYRKALQLDPSNANARSLLEQLRQ